MITFQDLFEQYAAISLEKQLILQNMIGDSDWRMNTSKSVCKYYTLLYDHLDCCC